MTWKSGVAGSLAAALIIAVSVVPGMAQPAPGEVPAPRRTASEGAGPYKRLVIRGVTLIDGTGGPPRGPVDIVIDGNRITDIVRAGWPKKPMEPNRPPRDAEREIDATGMYVLPGFVDMHAHGPATDKAPNLGYAYKLWLAHGITTVRSVLLAAASVAASEKRRSAANEIAAPRIFNYQVIGSGWDGGRIGNAEQARAWVRWAAKNDIDGIKFFNRGDETPEIDRAAIDEAKKLGLGTVGHLSVNNVARFNAEDAGAAGLGTITHFYGHFEALMDGNRIQRFPTDYDYENEAQRFGEAANVWLNTFVPGSPEWAAYLRRQKERGVTFDPTFNIYNASRDLMRARTAEWNGTYVMPQLWTFFQSNRDNHGSYFYDWTTEDEVHWRDFYKRFGQLIRDYNAMGGRVTTGSDPGFIYKTYGFGYIEELELLREVGLTPLEVIRSATLNGADTIYAPKGEAPPFGTIERGKLADLVIVKENPLANLKTLYGTGTLRLNDATNKLERVGGVSYTVKDGIVYDAKALLAEVAAMVKAEKDKLGWTEALPQP